ncbi:unnamed protein product [Leuciscus chuanchicus]
MRRRSPAEVPGSLSFESSSVPNDKPRSSDGREQSESPTTRPPATDYLPCFGAVEILTLCSQTPHPVTTLSSLSSTSPLIGEVPSCELRRCIPACTTAPLTADRLFGLLSVIVASVYFPPLLSPSLLLSHRVGAATSSCNPALQKAVIELEIHAGIIAVI